MHVFKKTQIALAVGSALMVMAGSANAATPPVNRSTNPAVISLISGQTDTTIRSLLSTTGLSGQTVAISANLTSTVTTAGIAGDIQAVLPGAPTVLVTTLNVADATLANRNVLAYTGTLGTTTALAVTSATFNPDATSAAGTASIDIVLTAPVAPAAYRINAGNLEYTSNNGSTGGTAVAFAPVKLDIQSATAVGAIIYTENTGATPAGPANAGYIAAEDQVMSLQTVNGTVKSSLAPTPTIKTTSASKGTLINGFVIDTGTPITLGAANLAVKTAVPAGSGFTGGIAFPAASMATPSCSGVKCTVTFPALGTTATAAGFVSGSTTATADDAAAYKLQWFNTGVTGATVPFSVDGVTAAGEASYTEVFNVADGAAAKLDDSTGGVDATHAAAFASPAGNVITDGAAPAIVTNGINFSTPSTAETSLTNLSITFSESMTSIDNSAGDLRELLENILVGSDTLASLAMNLSDTITTTPTGPTFGNANNVNSSVVTITDLPTAAIATAGTNGTWTGKDITVNPGITYQEVNDANYEANALAGTMLDDDTSFGPNGEQLAGGIMSNTGEVEALVADSQTAVAPAVTIQWGRDTNAEALPPSGADTKLSTIVVTFDAGKEVKLASGKTNANLAANLVVDVYGSNNIKFQVRPTTATLDTNKKITVTLPTGLIYEKLTDSGSRLQSVWIGYVAGGEDSTNNVLVADTTSSTILVEQGIFDNAAPNNGGAWDTADLTAAGAEPVVLPLVFTATATGGQSTLLTQSIHPTVVGASQNSIIRAYLARWADTPEADGNHVHVKHGIISKTDDKLANGLAIEFDDLNTLVGLIEDALDEATPAVKAVAGVQNAAKAVAAANIPVYVKIVRSNDATANQQTGNQNYLYARAILSTDLEDLWNNAGATTEETFDDNSPIYMAQLNPNTGAITGNLLRGQLTMDNYVVKGKRGLVFLDTNGQDTNSASAAQIGSALVGANGELDLLMGIDPRSTDYTSVKLNTYKPFVLLVHESSTTDAEVAGKGKFTMLTSADPNAVNYLPFTPDITNTAAQAARATVKLSLTDIKALLLPRSVNWALYGLGAPAEKQAGKSQLERMLVGLDTTDGLPTSFWTEDTSDSDMAMALAGNKVGVATELKRVDGESSGVTLTNITAQNQVAGAAALAWSNDRGTTDGGNAVLGKIFIAQATGAFAPSKPAAAPKLPAGWSLVTVPADGSFDTANVDAVIKVGAQVGMGEGTESRANSGDGTGQFSWFAEDGVNALPTLTAGDAVFVHAKKAGDL